MKKFFPFLSLFRNKFLVTLVVFVVWIAFFDRNDLFTQYDRKEELNRLETSKEYYQAEIAGTKKDLLELNNNPQVLEKFAREKFYLKRANEDVFIVEDSVNEKKVN